MTTFRSRGEIIQQTEGVRLQAQFRGPDGLPADLDSFPLLTIIQPSGNVMLGPTSTGVYHISTGLYGYDFITQVNTNIGVWTDYWEGTLSGFTTTGERNFVVYNTQMPAVNSDGYESLGDDIGFTYSPTAIHNVNKVLKVLRVRLNSSGKARSKDEYGNEIYIDCDIYSIDQLVTAAASSITSFNQIPHFTSFTYDDSTFVDQFLDVLVQGAVLIALSSKALIERGREFQVSDNGLQFTPPAVSELLNTQWSAEATQYMDKVKIIKASMKPSPLGCGLISVVSSRQPIVSMLRHRRARQIL